MTLPDCMMPDGADPCTGYHELRARLERAERLIARSNDMLKSAHVATGKVWERHQLTEDNDAFLQGY